ncbi:MAG: tripartite tricarboxylate transporter substrate binding protein [Comamonadaceae bacterium]|nr:MAG: tripartite tricarboxylate transporter substrate binding protein [Comamonadaceae bacterium]
MILTQGWMHRTIRAALGTTLMAGAMLAHAEFPDRPIKLVAPYAPGGAADILARALATEMGKDLGQTVIVENRPGANTRIASVAVARSPADGYTLLLASNASMVLNPLLYRKIGYTPDDFRVLGIVAEAPLVIVTNMQVPANNLKDFTRYAQANVGRVNYASVGLGNPLQLATEMLKSELGIEATHVPYNGSVPALTGLMANDTQLMFDVVSTSLPHIRGGKLKALAVTGNDRLKSLPDVPTVAESAVPGFRAATWFGVAVPAGTPPEVAARVQSAVQKATADLQFRATLDQQSLLPQPPRGGTVLTQYVEDDRAMWSKVIRDRNIVLDDAGS